MANIGKGSKQEYGLTFGGLATATLTSYRVDFYAQQKADSPVNGYCVVENNEPVPVEGTDFYSVVCDTTGLDLGTLYATVTVVYETAAGVELTEISTVTLSDKIVELKRRPDPEPVNEEEPENEEP